MTLFLVCFYIFYSAFNVSLNQNKIIKWCYRNAPCFFVRDENRESEHLGGTQCFVSGF